MNNVQNMNNVHKKLSYHKKTTRCSNVLMHKKPPQVVQSEMLLLTFNALLNNYGRHVEHPDITNT